MCQVFLCDKLQTCRVCNCRRPQIPAKPVVLQVHCQTFPPPPKSDSGVGFRDRTGTVIRNTVLQLKLI